MVSVSLIKRMDHAVDLIGRRSQRGRRFEVVQMRRGYAEGPDAARDRQYAAHQEDRDADVVIFEFYDDEGTAGENRASSGREPTQT